MSTSVVDPDRLSFRMYRVDENGGEALMTGMEHLPG
jgi:hypothetical protein